MTVEPAKPPFKLQLGKVEMMEFYTFFHWKQLCCMD